MKLLRFLKKITLKFLKEFGMFIIGLLVMFATAFFIGCPIVLLGFDLPTRDNLPSFIYIQYQGILFLIIAAVILSVYLIVSGTIRAGRKAWREMEEGN